MPSVDLTSYYQPQSTTSDGTKFDNLIATIQSALNALDNSNFVPGTPLAVSKLAPGSNGQVLTTTGGVTVWAASSASSTGTELDYKQITADTAAISATTEGTATAVVTANSITYDGTKNRIEFQASGLDTGGSSILIVFVVLRDATVIGQIKWTVTASSAPAAPYFALYDTPTAAAHTYKVSAFVNTASVIVKAGAGGSGALLPAFLRVTKA